MSESNDKSKHVPPRPAPPARRVGVTGSSAGKPGAARPPVPRHRPAPPLPAGARPQRPAGRLLWWGTALGGATVVVALAALLALKLASRKERPEKESPDASFSDLVAMASAPSLVPDDRPAKPDRAQAAPKPLPGKPKAALKPPEEKKPAPSAPMSEMPRPSALKPSIPGVFPLPSPFPPGVQPSAPPGGLAASPQAVAAKPGEALASLGASERVLELPRPNADEPSERLTELARIPAAAADAFDLSLLGAELVLGGTGRLELSKAGAAPEGERAWNVVSRGDIGKPLTLATFVLKDGRLSFQWSRDAAASSAASRLPLCLLEVKTPTEAVRVALRRPREAASEGFPFGGPAGQVSIPLDPDECPDRRHVRLELQPEGFPGLNLDPRPVLAPGDRRTLDIASPNAADPGPLAQIEVGFKWDGGCGLALKTIFHTKELAARTGAVTEKKVIVRADRLPQYRKDWGSLSEAKNMKAKQLADCQNQLKRLQAMRDTPSRLNSAAEREMLRQTAELQSAERLLTQQLAGAEVVAARAAALMKLLGDLQSKARLGYLVHFEVEGEKVALVRATAQAGRK